MHRDVHFDRQLLISRLASEFLLQLEREATHLCDLVDQMDRETDGLGLVGQSAFDGLFDPPRAVGRKFTALRGIKPLDRLHQPNVALADQVQQRQSVTFVIMGDLNHQPEVGLDHLLTRLLVALFDPGSQFDLLIGGEEFHLANLAQVELDSRVGVVAAAVAIDDHGRRFVARHVRRVHQFDEFGVRRRRADLCRQSIRGRTPRRFARPRRLDLGLTGPP